MYKINKNILCFILALTTIFILSGCGSKEISKKEEIIQEYNKENLKQEEINTSLTEETDFSKETNPIVTFEIENFGIIKAELYPEVAPNTVRNFIELVNSGFYNGLTFHRVVKDFVIQGGDKVGDGTGDAGYTIKGEFSQNGFINELSHKEGILSMARSIDNDSASCQFFIVTGEATYLDGKYAGFGKVIEGMDIVNRIQEVEVNGSDFPVEKVIIKKVTIDTKGINYKPAEKIENSN